MSSESFKDKGVTGVEDEPSDALDLGTMDRKGLPSAASCASRGSQGCRGLECGLRWRRGQDRNQE